MLNVRGLIRSHNLKKDRQTI